MRVLNCWEFSRFRLLLVGWRLGPVADISRFLFGGKGLKMWVMKRCRLAEGRTLQAFCLGLWEGFTQTGKQFWKTNGNWKEIKCSLHSFAQ